MSNIVKRPFFSEDLEDTLSGVFTYIPFTFICFLVSLVISINIFQSQPLIAVGLSILNVAVLFIMMNLLIMINRRRKRDMNIHVD